MPILTATGGWHVKLLAQIEARLLALMDVILGSLQNASFTVWLHLTCYSSM